MDSWEMSRHVMPCDVTSCDGDLSCLVMWCHVLSCHFTSCHLTGCEMAMQRDGMLCGCDAMCLCDVVGCEVMLCDAKWLCAAVNWKMMCCKLRIAYVTVLRLRTTKCKSCTTPYYSRTTPVLQTTARHYKVLLGTTKYYSIHSTSSSRASRGRKFQKKKELYSKERICL